MRENYWDLLRIDKIPEGIRKMRDAYLREGSTSEAMELGVAYLWVENFQAAWEHFRDFSDKYPFHNSGIYGMAGVAKWCLNEPEHAVHWWREGLHCNYADSAGAGFRTPLLLYFASVAKPEVFPRDEAEALLADKAEDYRIKTWAGPLVSFALGRTDEKQLRDAIMASRAREIPGNQWQSEFYIGVSELARGERFEYMNAMSNVSNVSWSDYDNNMNEFLSKLWHEEFFLARHEASKHLNNGNSAPARL